MRLSTSEKGYNLKRILTLVLCSLFIGQVAFSQEAAKKRIFVFQDFSGGLATKISDQTTNPKYAQIAENCRLDTKLHSISKRGQIYTFGTAVTSTEAITSMHRLYLSDLTKKLIITQGNDINVANDTAGTFSSILALGTADYRWKWVTWHNLAIGGDGYNQPVKTDGTHASYLGTCYSADNGAGAGPNGAYNYKVSFYTTSYEVLFNVASNLVTVTDNDIDLSMIPIGPDTYVGENIIGRKIYRSEVGGAGTYKLLTNGTIANNTATTLTDSDADAALGAAYPAGTATWTPPKGKFYCINQDRLFIANNPTNPSRVWYSKQSSHDLFETATDYRDIRSNDGDEVTGLFNLLGILRIPKTNTWQSFYTSGDDPDADWSISDPLSSVGCDAPYSAVTSPIGIIYLSKSRNGLYVFNGQSSWLLSEIVTPVITDILSSNLGNVAGEYNNNLYYMSYASSAVGGSTNNRILIYDVVGKIFTIDIFNINSFCSFSGGTDGGALYAGASDSGKVYTFGGTSKEILHSKSVDLTGTFDDTRIIPVVAGGDVNDPDIELAWDVDINNMVGTINAASGDVNRPDTSGTYISQVINTAGASTYDKIYWNETLASGQDITLAVRSGASSAACQVAAWSSEGSIPAGSDISAVSAGDYTQYRASLSTGSIDNTPTLNTNGGFTVKLSYNTVGSPAETAVALHWRTGDLDFGIPGYKKVLRKIYTKHSGTNGTIRITFTNENGDTDYFDIDTSVYPTSYEEYFTNGAFYGTKIRVDITNSDLNTIRMDEVVLIYDIEPLV